MLIGEELLMLALDRGSGRRLIAKDTLELAIGAALLAELALLERINVTPKSAGLTKRGRLTVTNLAPTDDPVLNEVLQKLDRQEGRKVADLVGNASRRGIRKGLLPRLLRRLTASGALAERRSRLLGVIPQTRWPAVDSAVDDEVRRRLQAALVSGLTPSERTVTLIGMLEVTGLLTKVVVHDDRSALRARAKVLTAGDWAAKAVKDAIAAQSTPAVAAS